jgi:ATP-binding cassette subfamily F protein 3
LDIENQKAKIYNGNYTTFAEKKKKDREVLEHHYKNQQREIAKMEAFIEQQRRWNREKNIIAAESRMKALERMEKIDRPENSPEEIRLRFPDCPESGNDVLRLSRLGMSFGERKLFSNLSLLVKKGQRLLIIGDNGCGKSTLLKILTGNLYQTEGVFEFGFNLHIGYYDQENQNLIPTNTVLDEIWDSFPDLSHTAVRNTLALFNFTGDDVGKRVENLSGGERARLTLAKLTLSKSNLLILDEVTNHLDIGTREVV